MRLALPVRLIAGLTRINNYSIYDPRRSGTELGKIHEPEIVDETVISSWEVSPEEALAPFFEHVWDEFGLERQRFVGE